MKNITRSFTLTLALLVILASFACRTKTTKNTTPVTVPTDTVAEVPATSTQVEAPEDFVTEAPEPVVTTENLGGDIEEVNRRAHAQGWLRDAFFEYDASTLSADAQEALATTANWLRSHPEFNLLIEGHCDERGTEQYNLALGDRRANTARDYLTTLGIDGSRIRTVSYGEERPFETGNSESAYRANRRAHLVLVRR